MLVVAKVDGSMIYFEPFGWSRRELWTEIPMPGLMGYGGPPKKEETP